MNKVRTYSCLILAHVFILFAAVQYNDPDPEVWMPIYMFIAILCVVAIFKPIPKSLLIITLLTYLAGAIYLFPDRYQGVDMPMNQRVPEIELARESLGLLICVVALAWLLFLSYKIKTVKA
jgi:hypothetical protein